MNQTSNVNITYAEQYIAFLDVLGFKELVKKDTHCEKISEYFTVIRNVINQLNRIRLKQEIKSIVISDSIILAVHSRAVDDDEIKTLRQFCIAIGLIQQQLVLKNLWLRGAVSLGAVHFSQNNVVGPAYIKAYELESKHAIYPRVIIDPEVIGKLFADQVATADELIRVINMEHERYGNWSGNILYNKLNFNRQPRGLEMDLPLFVDYLSPIFQPQQNNAISDEAISQGETIIDNLLSCIYMNVEVYKKYRWVADYILATINEYGVSYGDDGSQDINSRIGRIQKKLKMT